MKSNRLENQEENLYHDVHSGGNRMNVVVSGGTGFIGGAAVRHLADEEHTVVVLTRNPTRQRDKLPLIELEQWDARTVGPWAKRIDGADAVVNLAGESIGGKRWRRDQKARIIDSRISATKAIVDAIAQASKKPRVLVSASAVGYYGHVESGDVTESHGKGKGFLAAVVERWEQEAREAEKLGVRVVLPRFGLVLEKDGGSLKKLALPMKLFAGGWLGSSDQWFPWIHRDDVVGMIEFAIQNAQLSGPLNVAAPDAVTMKEFCKSLGRALHRPCWAPVPSVVLRAMLGEMSEMLLTGQRVVPRKLLDAGYRFRYPTLDGALTALYRA